ncbi:MAG: RNA polymerase sigma-70 factor [Flavobacterium sp.]|nr:RNA polymerase sigma-70 factor [Flavobacterium sp.]
MPFKPNNSNKLSTATTVDEQLLLQQIAQGDRAAYTTLYQQYLPGLYQYIFRFTKQSKELTEEIIQEVFLSIWEKKENLVAVQSFDSYLYRIAKNKLLNLLKHHEHKQQLHLTFGNTLDVFDNKTENALAYTEYLKTAQRAINNLPEKRRLVFLLSTQQGLSLDEIAEQMQLSKSMVKKHLYTAKDSIKQYLQDNAEWLLTIIILIKAHHDKY